MNFFLVKNNRVPTIEMIRIGWKIGQNQHEFAGRRVGVKKKEASPKGSKVTTQVHFYTGWEGRTSVGLSPPEDHNFLSYSPLRGFLSSMVVF